METTLFDTVAILFVVAATFGYLNHRLIELPFAIGMMVSGLLASLIVIGIDAAAPGIGIGPMVQTVLSDIDFSEALMHGMLSFLLFAGSLHTDMDNLKRWAGPIFTLASIGVIISTAVIGIGSWAAFTAFGLDVPFLFCLVFGALITPTDPVAVLGIMKAAGAPKDVEIKVIGESLFNDGVGVVVFTVLLAIAAGGAGHGHGAMDAMGVVKLIGVEVVGGIALGLISGYGAYRALRSINEPNLETLISVALVMGITLVAFQVHTSAPLACVIAGLFLGNHGRHDAMSDETEEALDIVWSFIDEGLNAILFLLVGLEVMLITFTFTYLAAAVLVVIVAISARGLAVFLPIKAFERRLEFIPGTKRVLWWGGIKGGISIALALSLPEFEGRDVVLAATYVTVVVSVLAQGLTIGKLIERVMPGAGEPA